MSDLVAWLTKILDEDTARAKACDPVNWHATLVGHPEKGFDTWWIGEERDEDGAFVMACETPQTGDSPDVVSAIAGHVAAYDPAAVLADIAAKRAIIDLHGTFTQPPERCRTCVIPGRRPSPWPCDTVRLLASIYADRPGYDDNWKP